jgi:integrase/recombinase XerD
MPKKGWRKERPEVGDPTDPQGLAAALDRFTEHLTVKNFSPRTVEVRDYHVYRFIAWCDERSLTRPTEVTREIVERYQKHLCCHRKPNGNVMTPKTQSGHLTSLRVFFKWLTKANLIPWNPASELELPKVGFYLPHGVLDESQIEQIINHIDLSKRLGIRDRALLEVLYSTGIRRKEASELDLTDLKPDRGVLLVRQGKGGTDRVVPIGERAVKWTEKYLTDVRPNLLPHPEETALFLTQHGDRFAPHNLGNLVKKKIIEAGIEVDGACHVFRHSMATLMLENGADIRYIQEILGHAKLETTQVYTRVSIEKLKEIHTATHPARLKRDTHVSTDLDEDR